ncbi:hypothetical protein COY52_05075 [Candidatus Desantisbacteria bacterium CG_4_10_14_0_8_um_filter_48_22]|uniref:Putative zinc-finger domain-containing protein n=1 Tax=Candidatus Desantisbacteria bacterium CG_4_10_14_0_8_um_filter_48_22 TaxID=1974543 RepID=A0A2M7SCA4_9BACT|nr:MAG: hypothetical protein AUJ67_02185 [Candidatus Desantisbacteria bacterium CG1_02_49_89]PIV56259.1 MAG: hypothetical protein COS16_04540 [Candidatus Desantisbacteria bacterium CG02_land_8_20_14_3_00_49_13]PIZ17128.1 MAG: hypothetical protein COY52_05075 [Candidatus Desantisbacteria bacterium CG_4_10_14_0_8_um_filter_48_22]PJB28241.1 MAG: hypothetical protein CO111_02145 [Candidatus Desantisbacteria bacterium CG_4_9_14_3_um_filter_50_7]
MQCDHRDLIRKYLDSELAGREKESFERHLCSCSECSRELSFYKGLDEKAKGLEPALPPQDFTQRVMAGIEEPGRAAAPNPVYMKLRWAVAYAATAAGVLVPLLGY